MGAQRILLIDDDVELCEEFGNLLKDEGYEVTSTSNSQLGMTFLEKHKYDLLILDFKMQGYTGIDILKIMKRNKLKMPVFLISGRPLITNLLENEDLSAYVTEVMPKPFDFEDLLKKIRALK